MPPLIPPGERMLERSSAMRYSNTAWAQHANLSGGMMRDPAPYEIPDGGCYTAQDFLVDVPGKLRKRGGYTSPSGSNTAAVAEWVTPFKSGALDAISTLFGTLGKGGLNIRSWNRSTGASTSILADSANDTIACKPFQHGNLMVCAFQSKGMTTSDRNKLYFAGGGTTNGITITAATVVSGDNRVTAIAGPTLVASNLGSIIQLDDGGTHQYAGRIVEITSTTACRVDSIPQATFTANDGTIQAAWTPTLFSGGNVVTGRFGCSYQGRIVFAYTQVTGNPTSSYAKGLDTRPARVIWSKLQTEAIIAVGGAACDGIATLYPGFFGENALSTMYNFIDFPEIGTITALAPAGEGTLLVFGRDKTFRIAGQLNTETALNPDPLYTRSQVSSNVGCIEQRSIQLTRQGLIFAGADNLYAYDGSTMTPLLTGKNSLYFQNRLAAGDVILGSFYHQARGHYYLSMSGTDGGMLFNLSGMEMTLLSNMPIFDSAPDPDNASLLWAIKWWDVTGAAPTIVKGQLWAAGAIFLPTSANVSDADGTNVLASFEARPFPEAGLENVVRWRQIKIGYDLRYAAGTSTVTLSADATLNTPDASYVTIGTLAETTQPGMTGFQLGGASGVKKGQALQVKLVMASVADKFEILSIANAFQPLRQGRSS